MHSHQYLGLIIKRLRLALATLFNIKMGRETRGNRLAGLALLRAAFKRDH